MMECGGKSAAAGAARHDWRGRDWPGVFSAPPFWNSGQWCAAHPAAGAEGRAGPPLVEGLRAAAGLAGGRSARSGDAAGSARQPHPQCPLFDTVQRFREIARRTAPGRAALGRTE